MIGLGTTPDSEIEPLKRLAYLLVDKEIRPSPTDNELGVLEASFFEIWHPEAWEKLFGAAPTLTAIEKACHDGMLRSYGFFKSPSGVVRARIYNTLTATLTPQGDGHCERYPTLPRSFAIRYQDSYAQGPPVKTATDG